MSIIKCIDLGADGIAYVMSQLKETGLLSALTEKLFDNKGTAFAPWPDSVNPEQAKQFNYGVRMTTNESYKCFADYIDSNWSSKCQLVFVDPWMLKKDFNIHKPKVKYFWNNLKIYYVPDHANTYALLESGMKESRSFLIAGFVISPAVKLPDEEEVGDSYVQKLANNTQAIFVSAYDREGFVIWRK